MKRINVLVRDRNTLILDENAEKGDYIDLSSLNNIDTMMLENLIEEGLDKVYNKKLEEYKLSVEVSHKKDLENIDIKNQTAIDKIIQNNKFEVENIKYNYQLQIEQLNNKINQLNENISAKINNERLLVEKVYLQQINELKQEIELLKNKNSSQETNFELILKNKENEISNRYLEIINSKDKIIRDNEEKYRLLERQKGSLHNKQIGEDLEIWCNTEMLLYMQNGLDNCTWEKDNTVVKNLGETKGSKGDFVFKVYASNDKEDSELISSVLLEMKEENPESVNKKKNSDYYATLDKNRIKKNCKYAVLVSDLETDNANALPIFRVKEYKDMYVVRPGYMVTFLNMIVSLSNRFASLVLADHNEKLELQNSLDLLKQFEDLKNTYLDKPLVSLESNINEIRKQNEIVINASKKMSDYLDKITNGYLKEIQEKLNKFTIKVEKSYKDYNKKTSS